MSKKILAPTYELKARTGDLLVNLADPGAADAADTLDLYIYDVIVHADVLGGVSGKAVAEQLAAAKNARTINVYINSAGGSVFDAVAIYNGLQRHKAFVAVHIDGMALSAASVVAMAGDKIHMAANAMMMIHNPAVWMGGEAKDLRHEADVLDKLKETIVATYAARSQLSEEQLSRLMDAETWYTAAEALEVGLADEITPAKRIAAHADLTRFRNTPARWAASIEEPRPHRQESKTMQERINKLRQVDPEAFDTALTDEYGRGHNDGRQKAIEEANQPVPAATYFEAFGETQGAVYFAKGVSFREAQAQYTAQLREQLSQAQAKLADQAAALAEAETANAAAIQDLRAQLAACRGEATPIDTSNAARLADQKKPKSLTELVKIANSPAAAPRG